MNMNIDPAGQGMDNSILNQVHEGMEVVGRNGEVLGKVERVYLGNNTMTGPATPSSTSTSGQGTTVVPVTGGSPASFDVDRSVFGSAFTTGIFNEDNISQELGSRLEMNGFIRLESKKLFSRDRYILPEQIETVSGQQVMLNTNFDNLPKR